MNINKAQCEAFRKNPSINPLTGREIQVGKVTHQKLVKACEEAGKQTSTSPPNRPAPPNRNTTTTPPSPPASRPRQIATAISGPAP